ncbi:hypothetical protein SH668x_000667 [Planctomicrobium sp. SH668]|uniref:hypothetical protein n=1 Tax=Planctomicrobium sp. SH668 TaxID=3448126 RepID=UPI003F5BB07A
MARQNIVPVENSLGSTTFYLIGLGLAIVIMLIIIRWIRVWYRDGDGSADGSKEILQQMEELNRQGVLSDQEFRSIKGQISDRSGR